VNLNPLNPDGCRGFERDPNPLPPNSFDGNDDVVSDLEFLARFAAKDQHAIPRFLRGSRILFCSGDQLSGSNGGRPWKRAQKAVILGEMG
jgi:hypothetical protein